MLNAAFGETAAQGKWLLLMAPYMYRMAHKKVRHAAGQFFFLVALFDDLKNKTIIEQIYLSVHCL